MTAKTWQGCVKIHEGCGGVCKWVEATHRRGVGYIGECDHCTATTLVQEDMVPIEDVDVTEVRDIHIIRRKRAEWDENESWEENQRRIQEELGLRVTPP